MLALPTAAAASSSSSSSAAEARRWRRTAAGRRRSQLLAATALLATLSGAAAFGEAPKYLIASSPSTSSIAYMRLPDESNPLAKSEPMRVLIDKGLTYPQGIAIDEYRQFLYVADPSLGKLVRFKLSSYGDALTVGKMEDVASPVEVRAVAVDGLGNVWFTDEPTQRVMRVTAAQIEQGHRTPQLVYGSDAVEQVRSPGGIAVDNYFVYWLNKAAGKSVGTLIKAKQHPAVGLTAFNSSANATTGDAHSLAHNSEKCYGVCIARGNVFFTDERNNLYGVPRVAIARSEAVTVSNTFKEPRGCAFDGDGAVYVADKGGNAVYMLASNVEELHPDRALAKVAELQGAFGVAVYNLLSVK